MAMTIQQLQDFSNTFPELRWLTEQIIDYLEANPSSPGVGGGLQSATVTLDDEEIKALPTTGVDVLSAQGVGKISIPLYFVLNLDNVDDYNAIDNEDGLLFFYGEYESAISNAYNQLTIFNSLQAGEVALINNNVFSSAAPLGIDKGRANKAIKMFIANNPSGNFTGGNAANTLKVTVYYVVVDL